MPAAASAITARFGRCEADLLPLVAAAGLGGVQTAQLDVDFAMPAHMWW